MTRTRCVAMAFAALAILTARFVLAQAPPSDLDAMSLEELLNTKLQIAARVEQTPEQAPSIVSVVTRQEIEAYGARDLADILRRVSGFELGIDVESLIGMSFRGIWVHEGKALVMINGQTVNDSGYGNVNYIGSYPASMIERVEVIRGPGSALYGGFAELAVVNVITAKGETLDGGRLTLRGATIGGGELIHGGNISFGGALANGLSFAFHVGYGRHPLSKRVYEDFFGNSLRLGRENSYRDWNHVIAEASTKNVQLRFLHTENTFLGQDVFTEIAPPLANGVRTEVHRNSEDAFEIKYTARLGEALTLVPLVEYIRGTPLDRPVLPNEVFAGNIGVDSSMARYRAELTGELSLSNGGRLVAGVGYIRDTVHDINDQGEGGLLASAAPDDVTTDRANESRYVLAQYSQAFGAFGVTMGARYESTTSGSALAPRAGVTFVKGPFNAKLLYGRAYRIPTPFQQYERDFRGLDLKPETADTVELEVGYKLTPNVAVRLNAFSVSIDDPITYVGSLNQYINFGLIRSNGLEGEINARFTHYGAFLNFAFAEPGSKTSAGFRSLDGDRFIGTQALKVNGGGYARLGPVTLAPSLTYLSPRTGESLESATTGVPGNTEYPSLVLANLTISTRELFLGLDLSLSAYNVFDANYVLIQPYYGGHAPLPAQDREVSLRLSRRF